MMPASSASAHYPRNEQREQAQHENHPPHSTTTGELYARRDDAVRGRHLVAARAISAHRLVLVERPLLVQPSLETTADAWVCHGCTAFVAGSVAALARRRALLTTGESATTKDNDDDDHEKTSSPRHAVIPCRHACGMVYCSAVCEADTWQAHHCVLCTGPCESLEHPLVQFKQYAANTNEMLLTVAIWWVAQHLTMQKTTTTSLAKEKATLKTSDDDDDDDDDSSSPYLDFYMPPWETVATLECQSEPGGFAKATALQATIVEICQATAAHLTAALVGTSVPAVTAQDVSVRMGGLEQNAMGIRQRHALCRCLLWDRRLREQAHDDLVWSLATAGYIGNTTVGGCSDDEDEEDDAEQEENHKDDHENEEDGLVVEAAASTKEGDDANEDVSGKEEAETEEWDFSVDEIASFLANLCFDEDGSVRDRALDDPERQAAGDDLDHIFPPLDGTALYATTCKMNHSCDPNVIVLYRRAVGWGSQYPLAAFCIARRDIQQGEELTISYIAAEQSYEERQAAISNYGFVCECSKCLSERDGISAEELEAQQMEDDLFGGDSEDEDDLDKNLDRPESDDIYDAEMVLQSRLERLDTAANHSLHGSVPVEMVGPVASFVMQTAARVIPELDDKSLVTLVQQCGEALQERDFCMCKIVGNDLEETLYHMLQTESSWPSTDYRESYWCGAVVAAVGYAHDRNFLRAGNLLDKALCLGLSRAERHVRNFVDYVLVHATQTAMGPLPPAVDAVVPDYREPQLCAVVTKDGLSQPIHSPAPEKGATLSLRNFHEECVAVSEPAVFRNLAADWPAITEWRDMRFFCRHYGHRLVPVEHGSMMDGTIKEELMNIRAFVDTLMAPSVAKSCWSLDDAVKESAAVGYLAQHPFLEQIPDLQEDVLMRPALCGPVGPTQVYIWMGTGGTRTPLHFDSYENLFVQLVGAKYVRLYAREDSRKLYIGTKSAYGLQGNMSDVDCEREDWTRHPLAESCSYEEVLLLPGDALYIPAHTWHYVRSLTTSISINYWF